MAITTDPFDKRLHEVDRDTGLQAAYLVAKPADRQKARVRPWRDTYKHVHPNPTDGRKDKPCGVETRMARELADTYAVNPTFYGATYCVGCRKHLPVDRFVWVETDGTVSDAVVGS